MPKPRLTESCKHPPCPELRAGTSPWCSRHKAIVFRGGDMDKEKRNPFHFITNVDETLEIADCSICGPKSPVGLTTAYYGSKRNHRWACKFVLVRTELRVMFNITPERYQQMFDDQGGLCAICRKPETKTYKNTNKAVRLCVDHDHRCCSGKKSCGQCVRGLLCWHCNSSLGKFGDDPTLLRIAADYLEGSYERRA